MGLETATWFLFFLSLFLLGEKVQNLADKMAIATSFLPSQISQLYKRIIFESTRYDIGLPVKIPITSIKHSQHFTNSALPVKLTPARWYDVLITWPNTRPADGTKLITPGGMPASRNILKTRYEDKTAEWLGFQSTTLPCKHSQQSWPSEK